jgi:hypothetical protein
MLPHPLDNRKPLRLHTRNRLLSIPAEFSKRRPEIWLPSHAPSDQVAQPCRVHARVPWGRKRPIIRVRKHWRPFIVRELHLSAQWSSTFPEGPGDEADGLGVQLGWVPRCRSLEDYGYLVGISHTQRPSYLQLFVHQPAPCDPIAAESPVCLAVPILAYKVYLLVVETSSSSSISAYLTGYHFAFRNWNPPRTA